MEVVSLLNQPVQINGTINMSGGINASIGGNTAGTKTLISSGTMLLAGGNNITLSQDGQNISIVGGAGGIGSVYAGDNVTLSTNGASTTVSVTGLQPVGAYLTTAMASNAGSNFVYTSQSSLLQHTSATSAITSAAQHTSNNSLFQYTSATSAITSLAMNTSERGNYFYTSNNTFANQTHLHGTGTQVAGTNISLTSASNGLSLSVGNYLTTAALSNHSHGNPTLNLTNISGTTASASNGLTLSLSGNPAQTVQTQNLHNLTLSGNTAGVMTQVSSGTLTLAGGNNITLSQNGNAITISGGAAGGADGVNAFVVNGGASTASTTLTLSNSNNVSFGLNAGVITASATFAGGGAALQGSGTYTQNTGTIQFANSNGMTFGLSQNGVMTGSHNGITTAMQSDAGSNFIYSSAGKNLTNISATLASNSISLSVGNYITTARASNDAVGLNTAATQVTWTVNSGGISLNAGAYLTTAAQSGHTHGNPSITGSVSITSNSNAWSISIPAFLTTAMASNAGSNFVSTSQSSLFQHTSATTAITANALNTSQSSLFQHTSATSAITASAMNTSERGNYFYTSNNTFANQTHTHGNVSGYNLTATSASNGLTLSVAAPGAAAENNWFHLIGNTSNASTASGSTISLSGGNNVTLAASNNNVIKIEAGGGGGGGVAIAASNTPFTSGTVVMSASGGAITINSGAQSVGFSVPNTSQMSAVNGFFLSTNGSTVSIGEQPLSVFEPRPAMTGSVSSSHATSWFFNPLHLPENLAFSKINIVKSFNIAMPALTSATSTFRQSWSLGHSVWLWSRSNYGAQSKSLVSLTSGSFGMTWDMSYNNSSHSATATLVTNSTGGTTTWSTASQGVNYSSYWTGYKFVQIPLVTTLTKGEYWIAHRHSTGVSTSNSNMTMLSVSNWCHSNQVTTVGGFGSNGSYTGLAPSWAGMGFGAVTGTANTMDASAITNDPQHYFWAQYQNLPVTTTPN